MMKNKLSNNRFSYVFTPRLHGNVLAWAKPVPTLESSKHVIEIILRWEEDGRPVSDTWHPLRHPAETNTARRTDGAE